MFTECERNILLRMAKDCKRRGLTQIEAQRVIESELNGFSTRFRIGQAVRHAFSKMPEFI